ncbi:aldo/keto reductase [Oceanibacterium hippocampi]|uniref:General stress protein 69 n=1 Tax=Oceanibacterium hippocampi TaxID=745714 RepID=A0A1Y5TH24_9PROT|nr:aldo/keto reductase [Oceanibacterium hippocampi]SLN61889.1 General stress protein 69 [Oceanibacterium hippocampi]
MIYRPLGSTGIEVSALALGGSTFGGGLHFRDETAMRRIVDIAFDAGVTFFDTSPGYGHGNSERVFGRSLAARRDKVVIATKGGMTLSRLGALAMKLRPALVPARALLKRVRRELNLMRDSQQSYSYRPDDIRRHLEGSLRRLGTDHVDLYQFYNVTESAMARDDLFDVMSRLKEEGKIRAAGLTVVFPDGLGRAADLPGLDAVQFAISLLDRDGSATFLPVAIERRIGVIGRSPLAQGFLTSADGEVMGHETSHSTRDRLRERADCGKSLRVLARADRSMAQTALRYALDLDGISTCLFAVRSEAELRENLGVLASPPLSATDLAEVERLAPMAKCSLRPPGQAIAT